MTGAKVREGYVCRRCGDKWARPPQGFSKAPASRSPKKANKHQLPITPPPGLWHQSGSRTSRLQRQAGELLLSSWDKLDSALQQKLSELGIAPVASSQEPDLTDVLKDNLAQLPAPVKELVERITKPQPPSEKDVAIKLKQQVSTLRGLSHRKQTLQSKIDSTKKAFQDLLTERKSIQTKIEQEQASLNSTSTEYMNLVS